MTDLTDLERATIKVLREPNGNGEIIDSVTSDYLSLFCFDTHYKILRGVLSSLVKKGIIDLTEVKTEWGSETLVRFTTYGNSIKEEV